MKISSVEEMQTMDKNAIEKFSIAEELLMENAGLAAYFVILKEFGIRNKQFDVFCGTGNNGGDGFVAARKIHSMGGKVRVFIIGDSHRFKGAAKKNFEIISRLPIKIKHIESVESLKEDILCCDAIIDALFGTGLIRNIEGVYRDVIQLINGSGKRVFSIDIPSGINGDSGKMMGTAVKADYTITYGTPKIGNVLYPGYEHCGKLYVSHISFPPSLYNKDSLKTEISLPVMLPERNKNAHKGDFGDVLFIAGASNYYGAPYFSALSFLKAGGGYSRLASPSSVTPFIASKGSEIVFIPQEETGSGSISLKNKDRLLELSGQVDMTVLGPGLSLNEETQELVRQLTKDINKPLLIDGDGITALSKNIEILKERQYPTVLTPHLGEMSRITNIPIHEIDEHKIEILREETENSGAIIVLKGAHSLIGCPDGKISINMSGNSGMATAGSGDVLTGTICAMFGLGVSRGKSTGFSLEDAVRTGVFMHGFSGDLAAQDKGEDGITAQDIMDYLPRALKIYREEYEEIVRDFYQSIYTV